MKNILLNVTLRLTVLTAFVVSVEFFNINQNNNQKIYWGMLILETLRLQLKFASPYPHFERKKKDFLLE